MARATNLKGYGKQSEKKKVTGSRIAFEGTVSDLHPPRKLQFPKFPPQIVVLAGDHALTQSLWEPLHS